MAVVRKPIDASRRAAIGKIHIAAKALRLEDDDYRALLMRITGRDSCTKMTQAQLDAVVAEFKSRGWQEEPPKERTAKSRQKASGQVRKVYALWNALVIAGGIEGLSERASKEESEVMLRGFVEKMTGVSSPKWLRGKQASIVIEALKDRISRVEQKGGRNGS